MITLSIFLEDLLIESKFLFKPHDFNVEGG